MKVSAIVAVDEHGAIGKDGQLMWHIPADMKRFKSVTMGHPIIMGRKTFESFPKGPLPGRLNSVLTRDDKYNVEGVEICHTVEEALSVAFDSGASECFVIGGEQVYKLMLDLVDTIYLTIVHASFPDADAFFPSIASLGWKVNVISREDFEADERNKYPYSFMVLDRI